MDAAASEGLCDADFIAAFERRALDQLPHRLHLRLASAYLAALGLDRAIDRITAEIRDFAAEHGHPRKYHETITRAWMYVVAHATSELPAGAGFDALLAAHPELLDKRLLRNHYSPATLGSPEARAHWVAPDLIALPGAPPDQQPSGRRVRSTA